MLSSCVCTVIEILIMRCKHFEASVWIFVSSRGLPSVGRGVGVADKWLAVCMCVQRGFAIPLLTCSCLNSPVPGQRGHQGEGAAAQHPALLAGAAPAQWCHHRIWDQVLRKSEFLLDLFVSLSLSESLSLHHHHIHFCRLYISYSICTLLWVEFTRFCKYLLCLIIAIMNEMLIRF